MRKGFTLIELLVVISIIGLLAAAGLATFSSAQKRARDARRISDIKAIETALAQYYTENNMYPSSGGAVSPNSGWDNSNDSSWNDLATDLAPYLESMPIDPINTSSGWANSTNTYVYNFYSRGYGCNRQWYMLVYQLESSGTVTSPGAVSCNSTNFNYSGDPDTVTTGACSGCQ